MITLKNKRGLSAVVAALMLILLVLALVLILWTVISNLVEDKLDESQSCLNIFDKVSLNDGFTCYNLSSKELQFSVSVADIDLDKAVVAVSAQAGETKSFELTNANTQNVNLKYFNGTYNENIVLPAKNSGKTYVLNMSGSGLSGNPVKIEIVPVVGGNQCDPSDSVVEIASCTTL